MKKKKRVPSTIEDSNELSDESSTHQEIYLEHENDMN